MDTPFPPGRCKRADFLQRPGPRDASRGQCRQLSRFSAWRGRSGEKSRPSLLVHPLVRSPFAGAGRLWPSWDVPVTFLRAAAQSRGKGIHPSTGSPAGHGDGAGFKKNRTEAGFVGTQKCQGTHRLSGEHFTFQRPGANLPLEIHFDLELACVHLEVKRDP